MKLKPKLSTMPRPKTKEFNKLEAKWYAKLKKEGFEDIEQNEDTLKLWSTHRFSREHNTVLYEAKEEYYRLAGQFLHEHQFKNLFEKGMWEYHSGGSSIRDIVLILKQSGCKVGKDRVNSILEAIKTQMMAKYNGQHQNWLNGF